MSRIFTIDYTKLVRILMPVILRRMAHVAWMQVLCYPVNMLYQIFLQSRKANLYRLKISPQVVFLEKLLNDRYDISDRRIRITDAIRYDPVFLYTEEESKPVFFFLDVENDPVYFFTEEEVGMQTVDFFVVVPANLAFNIQEMRALLDAYKLAGKTYKIQAA